MGATIIKLGRRTQSQQSQTIRARAGSHVIVDGVGTDEYQQNELGEERAGVERMRVLAWCTWGEADIRMVPHMGGGCRLTSTGVELDVSGEVYGKGSREGFS